MGRPMWEWFLASVTGIIVAGLLFYAAVSHYIKGKSQTSIDVLTLSFAVCGILGGLCFLWFVVEIIKAAV